MMAATRSTLGISCNSRSASLTTRSAVSVQHSAFARPVRASWRGDTRPDSASLLMPSTSGRFGGAPQAPSSRSRSVQCQGLFGLGLPELAVIAGVAALVFGPSKLPEIGKSLGKTLKSFQTAAKEFETELKTASADEVETTATPAAKSAQDKEERVKRTD